MLKYLSKIDSDAWMSVDDQAFTPAKQSTSMKFGGFSHRVRDRVAYEFSDVSGEDVAKFAGKALKGLAHGAHMANMQ